MRPKYITDACGQGIERVVHILADFVFRDALIVASCFRFDEDLL